MSEDCLLSTQGYREKIEQEAWYWGRRTEALLEKGITWEVDRRRAAKVVGLVEGLNSKFDPWVEELWHGELIDYALDKACQAGKEALDLGCGAGWLSLEMARRGLSVTAMDVSERQIQIAKNYWNSLEEDVEGDVEYQVQDLNEVVLERSRYDCILSFTSLHHILRIERLMRECHKALKEDGLLIVHDSVGMKGRNKLFSSYLHLLMPLPTYSSYRTKVKNCLSSTLEVFLGRKIYMKLREVYRKSFSSRPAATSPFEGVAEGRLIASIQSNFLIEEMVFLDAFGGKVILTDLKIGERWKEALLKAFKALDRFFCKTGILPGAGVYIIARKPRRR